MKRIAFLALVALVITVTGARSQSITYTHQFDEPVIRTNDDGYSRLLFENCYNYGEEGHPLIPYYGVRLLLPQNTEIASVKIKSIHYSEYRENITLKPAERSFPISEISENYQAVPDQKIYASSDPYPRRKLESEATHYLSGHSIGSFTICPVDYVPAEHKIRFIKKIILEINTVTGKDAIAAQRFIRKATAVDERIKAMVENPESMSTYSYPQSRSDEVDILLITSESLIPAFGEYMDYKELTGYYIQAISVEEIFGSYTGQDEQEKIRNCIIDYYENQGISYVILGGDSDPVNSTEDIIPHRGFYVDPGWGYTDYDIPADLYYAALDGTWNDDGDNMWGEQGEDDLYAEVSVGRLCIDDENEIANFINKLMLYQNEPVLEDIEKALMVGELLWNDPTWGGDYKDEVAYGSSSHGYTTEGVSGNFTVSRLYEKLANWEKNDIFNQFNNEGVNLLNHLGHSNTDYNMKMYNPDITTSNYQNDGVERGFVIGYSQGCYNGSFDNRTSGSSYIEDCFSEKITTLETGMVAFICNSRYGWGQHSSTDGASQRFDREFYDAVFGENIWRIGDANQDSKEDNASVINTDPLIRWCYYEVNLLGDPTMDIWTAQPSDIVATYPASIPIGSDAIAVQTGIPFARASVLQDGELIGRLWTNENGSGTVEFEQPISSPEPLSISISAHNHNRFEGEIIVVSDQPYVIYESYQINDESGNNNGLADYGEFIQLDISANNVGNQPADDVSISLDSDDEFITITDNSENFGDFSPGEIITIENAFAFEIDPFIPDEHVVSFTLTAEGEETWTSTFSIVLHAPVLTAGEMVIDDLVGGNGNGRLDPGETANLLVGVTNAGTSTAYDAISTLFSPSEYITINVSSYEIGTLNAGDIVNAQFNITIGDEASVGASVEFDFEVNAGDYSAEKEFIEKIGLVLEDFETGDFSSFEWEFGGSADWQIIQDPVYEGAYAIQSGEIGNQAHSSLIITIEDIIGDSISFYRKVSSENNYDYLVFYMDGEVIDEWSGDKEWERMAYYVPQGTHTFEWAYEKDYYVTGGSDCAWLDYIVLPSPANPIPPGVEFESDHEFVQTGYPVQFYDLSTYEPTNWNWEFPGGTPAVSTEQNPVISYNEPGIYSVTLTATNQYGSASISKTDYITVVEPHWEFIGGNPADPVYTIYINDAKIEGADMLPFDELGVFEGETLVGLLTLEQICTTDNQFENDLIAFSTIVGGQGYIPGNPVIIKAWDARQQMETANVEINLQNPYGDAWMESVYPYEDGEYSIAGLTFSTMAVQQMSLATGYQFISSHMEAMNPDLMYLCEELMYDESLDFIRNSAGSMLQKIGPNWVNNIGDWNTMEGYLFKMLFADELLMEGSVMDPQTPMPLATGYQFISYLPPQAMDAVIAAETIMDNLDFMRNSDGSMLQKIGPNWVNNIGNMNPGEGYLVKMNAADNLIYPESGSLTDKSTDVKPVYYAFGGGNPADPVYTLFLEPGEGIEAGDEIAAFNGEKLLGSTVITSFNPTENDLAVFSTLIDEIGYEPGDPISLKMWDKSENAEFALQVDMMDPHGDAHVSAAYPNGDGRYSLAVIRKSANGVWEDVSKANIYPNPAKHFLNISSSTSLGEIMIFNYTGQLVEKIITTENEVSLDVHQYESGLYTIRLDYNGQIQYYKILIN